MSISDTAKELEMQTITHLPEPSSKHATCAWCANQFNTVIALIDHVDDSHLADKRDIDSLDAWTPTPQEVQAILAEMRPIIDRFAARDQRQLAKWAGEAEV
jgi:hypothetical protein